MAHNCYCVDLKRQFLAITSAQIRRYKINETENEALIVVDAFFVPDASCKLALKRSWQANYTLCENAIKCIIYALVHRENNNS